MHYRIGNRGMVRDYLNDQIDEMRCIEAICIFARLEIKVMVLDSNQSNGEFSIKAQDFEVSAFQVVSKARPSLVTKHQPIRTPDSVGFQRQLCEFRTFCSGTKPIGRC